INGHTCLVPGNEIGASSVQIALPDYSSSPTFTRSVTVSFTSSTGFAYANIHLDYGLKKTGGYIKGGAVRSCNSAPNDAVGLAITIQDCSSYTFSQNNGTLTSQTVSNRNVFKRDPGIAGLVLNSAGTPVANATVTIYQGTKPLATVYTDQDGWYQWPYKYTGKATTFTLKLPTYSVSQTVTLKS